METIFLFNDFEANSINVKSVWRQEKKVRDFEQQTDPISSRRKETQSVERSTKEIQTQSEANDYRLSEDFDFATIVSSIKEISLLVEEQLEKNLTSHAFDDYIASWEQQITNISCVAELHPSPDHSTATSNTSVTGISWNSSGSTIAVAYGKLDHSGWCTHQGIVCIWNIFNRKMKTNEPDVSIDSLNCMTSIEFHPSDSGILAGGSFNGQLTIWDFNSEKQSEDPTIVTSSLTEESHFESITKIIWIPGSSRKQSKILTTSSDGKVLIWDFIQKHDLTWNLEILQGNQRGTLGPMVTGGTSMSLNYFDSSTFVVGTEGGQIHKCVLPRFSNASSNCISFNYEEHIGPVNYIHFSPFHRNVFLSGGSDTNLRIYNLLKQKAILVLSPANTYIYSVSWSPFRPLVFAAGTGDGRVFFYDLKKSTIKPSAIIEGGNSKIPIQCIIFNHKDKKIFATGDHKGVVKIYTLNSILTQESSNEKNLLNSMFGDVTINDD